MNRTQRIRLSIVLLFLIVVVCIWVAVFKSEKKGLLTVSFLDVGQGDAIFIEAPNGNQVLMDGGPQGAVLRALREVMPFSDRTIDLVIATHPDADHIGGFPDVFRRFDVLHYMEPGVSTPTATYRSLKERVKEEGISPVLARRGMRVILDEGVVLTILFPDRDVSQGKTNDASIVARLTYGEAEFLFTGDSVVSVEEYLLRLDGAYLRSDVLKVGHHGSKTSTSRKFLAAVAPAFGVVSAAKDNTYGHPHPVVVDALRAQQTEMLGTWEKGTIRFFSDGKRLYRK